MSLRGLAPKVHGRECPTIPQIVGLGIPPRKDGVSSMKRHPLRRGTERQYSETDAVEGIFEMLLSPLVRDTHRFDQGRPQLPPTKSDSPLCPP
jgi:hypothetical protein